MSGWQAAPVLGGLASTVVVVALAARPEGMLALVRKTLPEFGPRAGDPWTEGAG